MVYALYLCEARYIHSWKDADVADKAGDWVYSESPMWEAEEEQLITRLVVIRDEIVDLSHIDIETLSDTAYKLQ
jgi:hypothetical protein